jgi:hypothetical protein
MEHPQRDRNASLMNATAGMRLDSRKTVSSADADMVKSTSFRSPTSAKVIDSKIDGGKLYITVEGPSYDAVRSLAARNLAYAERFNHGFSQAGLESAGAPYPCNPDGTPISATTIPPTLFRATYKLTPG